MNMSGPNLETFETLQTGQTLKTGRRAPRTVPDWIPLRHQPVQPTRQPTRKALEIDTP